MSNYNTITSGVYRLSAYVGEVASVSNECDGNAKFEGETPASYGTAALRSLGSKEKARKALAQVAECALGMAENIDEWWEQ